VVLGISLIVFQSMSPIFASMIMPGWGEVIQGEKNKSRVFFIVEGSIWLSYFGFNYLGHTIDNSARAYAITHSDANPSRGDDDYFDALEDYFSSDDYNLEVERNASYFYPNDPEQQQQYIQEYGYFGQDEWEWDTLTNKTYYWERRKVAREHLRRASFMPGFAIINRIISVIDVVVFSKQEQFGLDTRPGQIGIYYKF
jgi:hypothetical protein